MSTYPTSQAGKFAGISASSVRLYSKADNFERHFSATATPEKDIPRMFDDDDIAKLKFISHCKQNRMKNDEIHQRLDAGEWQMMRVSIKREQIIDEDDASQLAVRLSAAYAVIESLKGVNADLLDTYNDLQLDLKETTNRLIEAEKQAAAGEIHEAEAERLRAKLEQLESKLESEQSKTWWDKLRGR